MTVYENGRLTDHALAVRYQVANLLVDDEYWGKQLTELDGQIRERFGVADTDGLADYVTGSHMTGEEAVEWAACDFDSWRAWLTGEMTWERWHEQQVWLNRGRDGEREAVLAYLAGVSGDVARDLHDAIGRGVHRQVRR